MDDLGVLITPSRLLEFFPTPDQSLPEKMNALTRLALYSAVALGLYKQSVKPLHFGAVLVVVLVSVWHFQTMTKTTKQNFEIDLSGTTPVLAPTNTPCRMPTLENPMMNRLYGDDPMMPGACRGPGIQETALALLDKQLTEDPEDLFGTKQMQRNFVTLPTTTIVEDIERYQNWLMKDAPNCALDPSACYIDDLRAQRDLPDLVAAENELDGYPTLGDDRVI